MVSLFVVVCICGGMGCVVCALSDYSQPLFIAGCGSLLCLQDALLVKSRCFYSCCFLKPRFLLAHALMCLPILFPFSKWSVVGRWGSATEEPHLHLPDVGQVWPRPRPHGGGARRPSLWDHAVFCPHPAQSHDRGRRRYAPMHAISHTFNEY